MKFSFKKIEICQMIFLIDCGCLCRRHCRGLASHMWLLFAFDRTKKTLFLLRIHSNFIDFIALKSQKEKRKMKGTCGAFFAPPGSVPPKAGAYKPLNKHQAHKKRNGAHFIHFIHKLQVQRKEMERTQIFFMNVHRYHI